MMRMMMMIIIFILRVSIGHSGRLLYYLRYDENDVCSASNPCDNDEDDFDDEDDEDDHNDDNDDNDDLES